MNKPVLYLAVLLNLLVFTLLFGVRGHPLPPAPHGARRAFLPAKPVFHEGFTGDHLDPYHWRARSPGEARLAGGRLELVIPSDADGEGLGEGLEEGLGEGLGEGLNGGVESNFVLRGDFDVQVEYSFPDLSEETDAIAGLLAIPEREPLQASETMQGEGRAGVAGQWGMASSSDPTGKLRLARSGSLLSAYHYDALQDRWILQHSAVAGGDDLAVSLLVQTTEAGANSGAVRAWFDHFTIWSGRLIYCQDADWSRQPVLLIHGWGGPDSLEDDQLGFQQLQPAMEATGYRLGCNLWYAAGVHAENNREANAAAVQSNLRAAYDRIKALNPAWQGGFDVVAHSYGGLNARFYLESAAYLADRAYRGVGLHVDNLFTLGTPHGGAILPFEAYPAALVIAYPHLTGAKSPTEVFSAMQLLAASMDAYNLSHRQPEGVCYRLIGGDFLAQGQAVPPILRRIYSLPFYARSPGDMGVALRSSLQLAANPALRRRYPHVVANANTDMHGYWPGEYHLGSYYERLDGLSSYVHPTATYEELIRPYLGAGLEDCKQDQPLDAVLESFSGPRSDQPEPVLLASGEISSGQIVRGEFPVDWQGETTFYLSWVGEEPYYSLGGPGGQILTPEAAEFDPHSEYDTLGGDGSGLSAYVITGTRPGPWTFWIQAGDAGKMGRAEGIEGGDDVDEGQVPAAAHFELYAAAETGTRLAVSAPATMAQGGDLVVTATLMAPGESSGEIQFSGEVILPGGSQEALVFGESGRDLNEQASVMMAAAVFRGTSQPGAYRLVVRARGYPDEGTDGGSMPFVRTAQYVVLVEPDESALKWTGVLEGFGAQGQDELELGFGKQKIDGRKDEHRYLFIPLVVVD